MNPLLRAAQKSRAVHILSNDIWQSKQTEFYLRTSSVHLPYIIVQHSVLSYRLELARRVSQVKVKARRKLEQVLPGLTINHPTVQYAIGFKFFVFSTSSLSSSLM